MIKNIFIVILCFALLFLAFNPEYMSSDYTDLHGMPSFSEVFVFGYELTVGTVELLTSILKGPDAFFDKFDQWRTTLFGEDVKFVDFLSRLVTRSIEFLDQIARQIPVVKDVKNFIDTILSPLENFLDNIPDWLK